MGGKSCRPDLVYGQTKPSLNKAGGFDISLVKAR